MQGVETARTRPTHAPLEVALIGVLLFEGALALVGGAMLVLAPNGRLLQMPTEWLSGSPFSTFLVPGVLLFALLGVLPVCAGLSLWLAPSQSWLRSIQRAAGMDAAWLASVASGMGIVIWIATQIAMVRMLHPLQAFIFALGAAAVALAFSGPMRAAHRVRA